MSAGNETHHHKIARLVSVAGHPLLTFAIFITFITLRLYDYQKALWISLLVIGLVIIPVTIRNYVKTKQGHYTNFDVSDPKQRQTFYPFLIALLAVVTLILYFIPDTKSIFIGTLVFFLMIVAAAIINTKIKCSLHTALSIYLSLSLLYVSTTGAVVLAILAVLIAGSRLVLKAHTALEVIVGGVVGLVFGGLMHWVFIISPT